MEKDRDAELLLRGPIDINVFLLNLGPGAK